MDDAPGLNPCLDLRRSGVDTGTTRPATVRSFPISFITMCGGREHASASDYACIEYVPHRGELRPSNYTIVYITPSCDLCRSHESVDDRGDTGYSGDDARGT